MKRRVVITPSNLPAKSAAGRERHRKLTHVRHYGDHAAAVPVKPRRSR